MKWDYDIMAEVYDKLPVEHQKTVSIATNILCGFMRRKDREAFFDFIYEGGEKCRTAWINAEVDRQMKIHELLRHSADNDNSPGKAFGVGPRPKAKRIKIRAKK
jgi:hypothetical protein